MARQKMTNPEIEALAPLFDERLANHRRIDREHREMAAKAKEAYEYDLFKTLFVDHAYAGDSEIANSLGISRSTAINWRRDFNEKYGHLHTESKVAERATGITWEHKGVDRWEVPYIYITKGAETVVLADWEGAYLLTDENANKIPSAISEKVAQAKTHAKKWDKPYADDVPAWFTDETRERIADEAYAAGHTILGRPNA